ncbi:MAG: ArsR/SmtB family transcription factor [Candidatus Odinarchaeota archaeon]
MKNKQSNITDVLKALNHEIRRKIIIFLHQNKGAMLYTDVLNALGLPASSNVAYHMNILNKALVIEKNKEGRYSLTELGNRSALLFDVITESSSSTSSNLYLGFLKLKPYEIILGVWMYFFIFSGISLVYSFLVIGIILILLFVLIIILLVYRTKLFLTVLLISNCIWIYFLSKDRLLLLLILISNMLGGVFLFSNQSFAEMTIGQSSKTIQLDTKIIFLLGLILFVISCLCSSIYLFNSYKQKISKTNEL